MSGTTDDSVDLYRVLGVSKTATPDEIKRAYLTLVREYTPERAPEKFKTIREAYETLSNPESRQQYDSRLDPRISELLAQASRAMKAQSYGIAEQAYKKVLLEQPRLHWVRNLLGLCFLYQEQSDQAIVQYERLLRESKADAPVRGNAAHAYRMAGRFDDAEREFRAAMRAAGDQAWEYGLALIQMTVDRGDAQRADKIASTEADASPKGSVAAVEYSARRIELAFFLGKRLTIPAILTRMSTGLSTEEQRRVTAVAMGKVSSRLIAGEAFQTAEQVAKAARALQPKDPAFDGLEQASHLLYVNDFDGVARLLNTHVSFAANGWLQGLRPGIQHYCTTHAAFKGMHPIASPPTLSRINGIGTTIHGHRDDDPQTGTYVATQYFTFFFVPLFPIRSYRVRTAPKGGWYFLGTVPYGRAQRIHWGVFLVLLFISIVNELVNQPAATSSYDPSPGAASLAPVPEPSSGSGSPDLALATYDGEAVNRASSAPLRSSIRLTIYDWQASRNCYLTIFPPLRGSGPCYLEARDDSVRFASVSETGDTIVWAGMRSGESVGGNYSIVGGPFQKQFGTWHLSPSSGAAIPQRLHPW